MANLELLQTEKGHFKSYKMLKGWGLEQKWIKGWFAFLVVQWNLVTMDTPGLRQLLQARIFPNVIVLSIKVNDSPLYGRFLPSTYVSTVMRIHCTVGEEEVKKRKEQI